jgi:hypothetical protein
LNEDELDRILTQLKNIDIDWAQQARKDIPGLVAEVRRLKKDADQYRLASLGLFDPVKVGQVVAQLQRERDEARKVARHHFILGRGGEEQRAAVLRDHPWLLEARTGRGEDDEC